MHLLSYCFNVVIRWLQLDITSPDVQASCEDLKVLGKGDFKNLLKWRSALREEVSYPFFIIRWASMLTSATDWLGDEVKERRRSC